VSDLDPDTGALDLDVVVVVVVAPIAMLDGDAVAIVVSFEAAGAANAVRAFLGADTIRKRRGR
jgi:hypothetical protein